MTESFEKLKRKHLIEAIIKSVINGASCGLFAVSVVLLALKLSGIDLHFGFYILIGVVVAAGCGTGLFFLFRPTDLKSAKRIDKEYGLNEKVQTMVEFAGQEGDILTLQREATGEILRSLPKPRIAATGLWHSLTAGVWQYLISTQMWQCVASTVLACAIAVPALVIPTVINDGGAGTASGTTGTTQKGPDFFEYDLYQQSAIGDLILDLRNSSLDDATIKPAFINVVQELDSSLKSVDTETGKKQRVYAAVQMIDGITDTANTYQKICEQLKIYNEELATSIANAVAVYKASSAQLNNFRYIKALEYDLGDMIAEALQDAVTAACDPLKLESNDDTGAKLKAFIDGLTSSLNNSGVNTEDELYGYFNDLRVALREVFNKVGKGYGIAKLNPQIEAAFDTFENGLVTVLKEQSYNRIMDVYTRRKLADIFSVPLGELPVLSDANEGAIGGGGGGEGPGGSGGDNPGSGEGGYGKGDEIYGSNDKIFDPDTGEYVEYGKLLNEYYQRFFERILNGDFEYVSEYFNILFGGIDDKN